MVFATLTNIDYFLLRREKGLKPWRAIVKGEKRLGKEVGKTMLILIFALVLVIRKQIEQTKYMRRREGEVREPVYVHGQAMQIYNNN